MERNFTLLVLVVTGGADFLADHQAPNQLMITIKDKIMMLVTMMKVPSIGVNISDRTHMIGAGQLVILLPQKHDVTQFSPYLSMMQPCMQISV